jgi:hypothetical protein
MQPHLGLAGGSRYALELVEALFQRSLAGPCDVEVVLRAVKDPPDFVVDEPLGVP